MFNSNISFVFSQMNELQHTQAYVVNRWTGNLDIDTIPGGYIGKFFYSFLYITDTKKVGNVFHKTLFDHIERNNDHLSLLSASYVVKWMQENHIEVGVKILSLVQEPLPKLDWTPAIQKGLPNIGSTCWMNSAIKCISTNYIWDNMLNTEPRNHEMKRLHQQLKYIVYSLRSGKDVTATMCKQFENEVFSVLSTNQFPGITFKQGEQNDAVEFLLFLETALCDDNSAPAKCRTEKITVYRGEEPFGCYGKLCNPENIVSLTLDNGEHRGHPREKADLGKLSLNQDTVEMRPHYEKDTKGGVTLFNPEDKEIENRRFTKKDHFVSLPSVMRINLNRFVMDHKGNRKKLFNLVQTQTDGFIHFTQYKAQYNKQDKIIGYTAVAVHRYRIKGAITHQGYDGQGHYVYEQTAMDGKTYLHSDETVGQTSPKAIGQSGYFFILERVDIQYLSNQNASS